MFKTMRPFKIKGLEALYKKMIEITMLQIPLIISCEKTVNNNNNNNNIYLYQKEIRDKSNT